MYLTHPSDELGVVCDYYFELLYRLLYRTDESPQDILEDIALRGNHLSLAKLVAKNKSDIEIVGRQFSPACYISDAWPSVLYFAYRYAEDGKKALTANANVGGDNVHRGFVLGTLLGLIEGAPIRDMFEQLADTEELEHEIQQACKDEE